MAGNNPSTVRGLAGRTLVNLTLAFSIGGSPAFATDHVHEADADHPDSVTHRHLQPHGSTNHDRDHAQVADDDDHVVWLDAVSLRQPTYELAAPTAPPAGRFLLTTFDLVWVTRQDYNAAPPHGPPRTERSPRAPPSLFA